MIGGVLGSPKNLMQASKFAMDLKEKLSPGTMRAVMRDYMAQKFSVALLKHQHPEAQEAIRDLWKKLTGEEI